MAERLFDAAFREEAALADGSRVLLRLLRPDDAPLVKAGFDKLSPTSRYRRFLSARSELDEETLRYLCETDGEDHFALGAIDAASGEGLGTARFVRLRGEPSVADPAVTVVDGAQGKGLGKLLLVRLAQAARERGVHFFRCEVLASNEPMRQLLGKVAPDARGTSDGETLRVDIPLDGLDVPAPVVLKDHPLYRIFLEAAAGVLVLVNLIGHARDARDDQKTP